MKTYINFLITIILILTLIFYIFVYDRHYDKLFGKLMIYDYNIHGTNWGKKDTGEISVYYRTNQKDSIYSFYNEFMIYGSTCISDRELNDTILSFLMKHYSRQIKAFDDCSFDFYKATLFTDTNSFARGDYIDHPPQVLVYFHQNKKNLGEYSISKENKIIGGNLPKEKLF